MAYESVVDADLVIGRDDLDTSTKLTFEGDDLELPFSGDEYEPPSPKAKHTDFDLTKGDQTVDGVNFDVGALFKGIAGGVDVVGKVTKTIFDIKKAAQEDPPAKPPEPKAEPPKAPPQTEPPKARPPKPEPPKPSSGPPVLIATNESNTGTYVVVGLGMAGVFGVALALAASRKRKRRAL